MLEEVPKVRKDLGEPPLVTPSSQIVGTQAVFNVLMGERYKMATKETKDVLSGKYGATVKPFNEDVRRRSNKRRFTEILTNLRNFLKHLIIFIFCILFFQLRSAADKSRSDSGRQRKRKLSGISEAHIEEITKIREIVWLELRSHNLFL